MAERSSLPDLRRDQELQARIVRLLELDLSNARSETMRDGIKFRLRSAQQHLLDIQVVIYALTGGTTTA
jgi:hypothetical protein